jgi:outer membrane protein OmpA-like peptidoglycan-associated protein
MKRLWTAISTIALVTGPMSPAMAQTSTSASGSNAGAVSGSVSGSSSNPVQTTTTNSGSVSGATSGSTSNSSSNPTNTTITNTNSTSGSNATANTSSNASTNAAASNQGNSQTINNNSNYPANQTVKTAPAIVAPALTTTLTETCMGSTSLGVSVLGFGATGGTTWQDHNCIRRLNARELAQTVGDRDAARELMCSDEEIFRVYNALGRPCRLRPDGSPNPAFAQAAPPPPTPPAPSIAPMAVVPGPFLVFFDWNRSEITSEAAATLDKAASSYQQTGSATLQLAGHTDKSGTEVYNRELSLRRAEAVQAYLTGKGVPREVMVLQGFGSTMPRVPTPDGVREPQNRRVEITFVGATGPSEPSASTGATPSPAPASSSM